VFPLDLERVCAEVVVLPIVTKFPDEPLIPKFWIVVVVPDVNVNVVGATPFDKFVIVLLPVMVKAPAPSFERVQLYVEPPPTNVFALAEVILILPLPVPIVVVNPVGTALLNAVDPLFGQTRFPLLKVRFLVPVAVV
jgi:hypothetical protein